MPRVILDHDTYMLYTDDGQKIDMSLELFSPMNMKGTTLFLGSEAAARECIQNVCDRFCQDPVVIGLKPVPGSTSPDVQVHRLFRDYSVRIWGAGLERMKTFHFDFVDPRTSHPVNLPPLWKIFKTQGSLSFLTPDFDFFPVGMEVKSMEAYHGLRYRQILPGEEKYMQSEGMAFRVISPSGEEAFFQLPVRRSIHLEAGQVLINPAHSVVSLGE